MSLKPDQDTKAPSLTIAILMFNEEANISSCLDETIAFCKITLKDWEIIVVDDGSRDSSTDIVRSYMKNNPQIQLVCHNENLGMGAGIETAIENASKDYFIYNAADGQVDPKEISKLLPLLNGADIALSTYSNRRETYPRELMSRAFRVYMRLVAGIRFKHQGLFLFPTSVAKELAPQINAKTFFFCFELVQRGIQRGLVPVRTEIICRDRGSGSSKVANPSRILKVGMEALFYGLSKHFQ